MTRHRALQLVPAPPGLHLRPAPPLDPPYDDERDEPVAPVVHGSLALAFPPTTRGAVPLRLVPPAAGVAEGTDRSRREPPPNLRVWTAGLAQAIAEVLAGARAPSQLSAVATLDVLALLERGAGRFGARPGAPARRPVVGSVHVGEPRDGVVEVCAVVDTGPRRRALAFRIEGARDRWRCTALQVG
ncbi:MAG TPA: Rv3235 family protein [Mycobacteriales bacterium]|nr:Rv3235 family protein [Mycobacteriales bacterium]